MKNKTAGLISVAFLIWSGSGIFRNLDDGEGKALAASVIGVLFFGFLTVMTLAGSLKKNNEKE